MSIQARQRWDLLTSMKQYEEGRTARRWLVPLLQNPYRGFLQRNETDEEWSSWNLGWDHEDIELRTGG